MVSNSRVLRDIHNLIKQISRFTDGQARIFEESESDVIDQIIVDIKPHDGLYKDGIFTFEINIDEYPRRPPVVTCVTNIYHPNIDPTESMSNVCLNIIESDEWSQDMTLEDVVQGLLFLFYEPNLDDPLCPFFGPAMDGDEFEANLATSLNGGIIEGIEFSRNIYDINWKPVVPVDTGQLKNDDNKITIRDNNSTHDEKINTSNTSLCSEDTYNEYEFENNKTLYCDNDKSPGDEVNLNQCDISNSTNSAVPICKCSGSSDTTVETCECGVSKNGLSVNMCTCLQNNALSFQTGTEIKTNEDQLLSKVVTMECDATTTQKRNCFVICVCGIAYEIEGSISNYAPPMEESSCRYAPPISS